MFLLTTTKSFVLSKQKEPNGKGFLINGKDYYLDNYSKINYAGAYAFLFILAGFSIVLIAAFIYGDIGIKIFVSMIMAIYVLCAILLYVNVRTYKKQIRLIKQNGKNTTAIIKKFFVYTLKIKKRKWQMPNFSFEFQIEGTGQIYIASLLFGVGAHPFGVAITGISADILTYDKDKNYYYFDVNKEVPIQIAGDKILFLEVNDGN